MIVMIIKKTRLCLLRHQVLTYLFSTWTSECVSATDDNSAAQRPTLSPWFTLQLPESFSPCSHLISLKSNKESYCNREKMMISI